MASQPPPYGYGPPTQQVPPPAPGAPGFGTPAGPPPAPPFGGTPWGGQPPTPPTPPKRSMSVLWVVLGAVAIAALVAGAIVFIGGGDDDDADDRTEETQETRETRPPRRSTTTVAETTTTVDTTPADSTTVPNTTPDGSEIDLGNGVSLRLPEGWDRTDGPDDEVVQVSDGTLRIDAQALRRSPGEDPASAMQEYVDLFDTDFDAVGYSPVTLRGTMGDDDELRNYGLYYRAIDADFSGFDGAVYILQRTDGLTVVLDYYAERPSESAGLPDEDYDALIQSILDAPSLGDTVTVPESSPFRITSVHPSLTVDGLAALTLPPGWEDQSADGAVVGFDGSAEWVVATKVSAQADADAAYAAVVEDLGARYPGLVIGEGSATDAWADLERRDGNIDAPADAAADPRPRAGGLSVFYDPATQNAFGFALFWYADANADGSEPSPDATDFIYDVFTDSFDTIP